MSRTDVEERPSEDGAHRSRRARRWRRGAAVAAALIVLPFVVIRIPAVSTPVVNAIASAINPYPGTHISIDHVSGGFLGGFELRGIRLIQNDGTAMLDVERLRASYWLPALLSRRVEIGRVEMAGARVRARQQSGGEWDWLAPFVTDSPAVDEPDGRAWRVDVGSLRIERSRIEAQMLDSTAAPLRVEDLEVRLADVRLPEAVVFDLDTLGARVFMPELPDSAAHVTLAGSFRDDVLRVSALRLHSAVSDVRGGGVVGLPGLSVDRLRDVDFTLHATPLDFRDIAPFVPTLSSRPSLELELRASTAEEWLTVSGEASLDDGATLSVDGSFWLTDGPVRWRLAADLRGLDPGHVLRDSIAAGPIDARLAFDLAGPARDRLSGPAELRLGQLDIGELTLLPSAITADFDEGLAQLEGEAQVASVGRADLSGAIRPFGTEPEFDLRVDVVQAPGDRLDAGLAVTDLDASLAVHWTGLDADSLRADAQLDLNAVRLNDFAVDRGAARLRWDIRSGDARVDATFAGGDLVARAELERVGQGWRARLHEARVTGLDLAGLMAESVPAVVELDVRGEAEGADAQSLRGDLIADLAGTRYADLSVERSRIEASLRDGRLAMNVDVRSNGGGLVAALDARPFDANPVFDVREVRLADLDLGRLGGPESRINVNAAVHAEGVEPTTMTLDGSIAVDSSYVGDAVVDGIRADYALAAGSLRIASSAQALGGDLELIANARPFDAEPTFTVALDAVREIDLSALTGGRACTALSGAVHVEGAGRSPTSLELDAVATIAGAVNRGRITEGEVRLSVAGGKADLDAGIETQDGELEVRGDATWSSASLSPVASASPSSSRSPAARRGPLTVSEWSIDATSRLPDLGDLADLPEAWDASVEATVSGRGSGSTRETLVFDLQSTVAGKLADLSVDSGRIEIAGRSGAARVDTLHMDANAFAAAGGGVVLYAPPRGDAPDSSDASFRIELRDAAPLARFASTDVFTMGDATLDARIAGPWARQAFDVALHAENATVDRVAAGELDVRAVGVVGAGSLDSADASLELTELAAGDLLVDSARAGTRYRRGERLPITLVVNVPDRRGLSAAASVDPEDLDAGAVIERAQIELVRETWSLPRPARVAWANALEVDDLFLTSGGRRLGADGRIDPKGEQAFRIRIDSIGVGAFSDMLGFPDLDGWVSGRLQLDGPAAMARVSGELDGRLGDRDGAMARLHATLESDGKTLDVTTRLDDDDDRRLTLSGVMPLRLSFDPEQPVEDALADGRFGLNVRADSVSTGWLLPFVRPAGVTELGGMLVADAALNGTAAAPSLGGSMAWVGGSVVMPELGVDYSDVTAGTEMEDRGIHVSAEARAGGTARVRGDIELDELRLGRLQLQSEFDRFHVLTNELTRFTMSGSMNIAGTTEAPQIGGRVRVVDTDFFLDDAADGASAVELTQQDLDMLRDYFGYVPAEGERVQRDVLEPIALDLAVQFGDDVWARRSVDPRMTLLLSGSLDVRKAAGDSIQLFGTLAAVPERSFFRQFQRRFQVTQGEVTFNGYIPTWRVDMSASYEVPARDADTPQAEIILAVEGGQEDLELTLDSNPTMEPPDIISYLATGRPAASAMAFGGDGGGVAETGASLAIGSAAGLLESLGADRIGLDVVEVRQDGTRGATFVGGRFLSSRIYVGFQQPIILRQDLEGRTRQETTRVELEYAAYRWLLANVQGGAGTMSVFLRVRRAY